jgi:WD40 repeat protein
VRAFEWVPGVGFKEVSFSPIGHHSYGVTDARFSPQGTMLATSSIDGSTVLWNNRVILNCWSVKIFVQKIMFKNENIFLHFTDWVQDSPLCSTKW